MSEISPAHLTIFRFFNEIGIIEQLARNAFERRMPDGLKMPHFGVLNHFVRLGGSRTPLELARAFQVTKGTMTNTIQRLQARQLISIAPDPKDGRSKRVEITEAGREMHTRAIEALSPALSLLEAQFGTAPFEAATPFLEEVRAYLDQHRQ
ncbi:MAG: MarR family transcriptional regulator [Hyphomicrobiaceae bacterium]